MKKQNISVVHSKSAAANALVAIGNKITPGDTLVFFYVGHGDWNRDEDVEPPVELTTYVRDVTFHGEVTQNRGNEYLAVNGKDIHLPNGAPNPAAQTITDDELADWFRAVPNSALVRKIAVLSACFSGGFWSGGTGPRTETGDLDLVPNTALLASTQESDTGTAEDTLTGDGRSLFVKSLEVALAEIEPRDQRRPVNVQGFHGWRRSDPFLSRGSGALNGAGSSRSLRSVTLPGGRLSVKVMKTTSRNDRAARPQPVGGGREKGPPLSGLGIIFG